MDAGTIEGLIKESLPDAVVTIQDLAVMRSLFSACSIKCLRRQNTCSAAPDGISSLKGRMGGELHATLQTSTPKILNVIYEKESPR